MSTIDFVEAREAGLEIGDEIVAVLQPGMDAQGRPRRVPARRRAHRGGVGEDHQAFVAAPACAYAEQLDTVAQSPPPLFPDGLWRGASESATAGARRRADGG